MTPIEVHSDAFAEEMVESPKAAAELLDVIVDGRLLLPPLLLHCLDSWRAFLGFSFIMAQPGVFVEGRIYWTGQDFRDRCVSFVFLDDFLICVLSLSPCYNRS